MSRLLTWAAIVAVTVAAFVVGGRPDGDTAGETPNDIAAGLRCPVCQGLSVKDSDSPTARDIRADIDRRLGEGESASDIRRAYVDRYGEWILLRPATSGFEALVWAIPGGASAGGAVLLAALFWRWRRRQPTRSPTEDERRLVAGAVAGSSGGAS